MSFIRSTAKTVVLAFAAFLAVGRPAEADAIRMVAPVIPPHFDATGSGRIGDVVRLVLDRCGHRVAFVMVPFGRHWRDYTDFTNFDGLATAEADQVFPGTSTRAFILLQDGASVLAGGSFAKSTKLEDLAGARVTAFPNAVEILGLGDFTKTFASYRERADGVVQVRSLLSKRLDAILGDGLIVAHFATETLVGAKQGREPGIDPETSLAFRRIFPPGPQRLFFRNPSHAADFDRCFAAAKLAGDIDRVTKPYVERYRAIVGDQYPTH